MSLSRVCVFVSGGLDGRVAFTVPSLPLGSSSISVQAHTYKDTLFPLTHVPIHTKKAH